jgi:Cysteine-rich CPXCG
MAISLGTYGSSPLDALACEIISLMDAAFQCAGCGEWNDTTVDESAGRTQSYVEDCQTCCKPNILHVSYDRSSQGFFITAQLE